MKVMKSILCLIFFLAVGVTTLQAQENTEDQQMTLEECIEYAYKNNTQMMSAMVDTKIAESTVGEVRSAGLPQVNAQLQYMNNYAIQTQFFPASNINQMAPPDEITEFQFGLPHTATATLSLQQLVFDGTYFLGLRAADVYTSLSKQAVNVTKTEIALNVTKAYYGVLVTKQRMSLLDQNIERVNQLLAETKELYKNGFVEELDVDKLSVTANNLTSERQRLDRFVQNTLDMLKFSMGMPVNENLMLSDELVSLKMGNQLIGNSDFDYNKRPEYEVYQIQKELDLLDEKRYKVGYYPSVFFSANYGYNGASTKFDLHKFNNWNKFGALGFTINVPIFDGFQKKYKIQQAQLNLRKTELNITQLEKSIDFERKTAMNTLNNSISTLETQSDNIALAKKIAEKTKIKYTEGVGSSLEVIQAETDLLDAQNSYFSALYDALIAKADYDKATGNLLSE